MQTTADLGWISVFSEAPVSTAGASPGESSQHLKFSVKLHVQPEDGIQPLLDALNKAKISIQILVFRLDRSEIEKALVSAVERGVSVTALIAYTSKGGEKNLRRFEMRLLGHGITVARTADDLVRYHGKMFIIDGKELHLLAHNFTHLDISLSRSFSVVITEPALVKEAVRLFDCDCKRIPYVAAENDLVVSPSNAREQLVKFIRGAKHQLLLYEMKVSDPEFVRLLTEKISEGVDVRVIGKTSVRTRSIPVRSLPFRLHTRAILRDGKAAFLGSQSLRRLELEARREVGVIFDDPHAVKAMTEVFEKDWKKSTVESQPTNDSGLLEISAKKVAKVVAKQIDMVPMLEQLIDKVVENSKGDIAFEPEEVAQTVREAMREEVHDAVVHALHDLVNAGAGAEEQAGEPFGNGAKNGAKGVDRETAGKGKNGAK